MNLKSKENCGFYGDRGTSIGVGAAVIVLTRATPLTGRERYLANEATALALSRMPDGHPRCCKRVARRAMAAAVEFLRHGVGIKLTTDQPVGRHHSERNCQCPEEGCPYYKPLDTVCC